MVFTIWPGRTERSQPFASTSTGRPSSNTDNVPENHGRDDLKTSTKLYSGLQSSMRDRLVPSGACRLCARGAGGGAASAASATSVAAATRRKMRGDATSGLFHGRADEVAPLGPRAVVVAHVRIAEQV